MNTYNLYSHLLMIKPLLSCNWILFHWLFSFFLKQVIIFYILAYTKHDSLILNAYLNKLLSVTSGSASSLLGGSLGEEVKMLSKESLRYTTPVIPPQTDTGVFLITAGAAEDGLEHTLISCMWANTATDPSESGRHFARHMATRLSPHVKKPVEKPSCTCAVNCVPKETVRYRFCLS